MKDNERSEDEDLPLPQSVLGDLSLPTSRVPKPQSTHAPKLVLEVVIPTPRKSKGGSAPVEDDVPADDTMLDQVVSTQGAVEGTLAVTRARRSTGRNEWAAEAIWTSAKGRNNPKPY
ncbi:hypothetical protein FRC11_014987 [Ceratobasidium sp. 423]|nr:hypothetical protein FRC11_014987 [Ceratobasidium sp. 423]